MRIPWKPRKQIPVNVLVKISDVTITPTGFGTPLIISDNPYPGKIETYGDIKRPRWFQFWKKKQYLADMEAEKQRMFDDFGPV